MIETKKAAVSETCEEPVKEHVRAVWGTCEDIVSINTIFFPKRFGDFSMILSITIENLK